MPKSKDDNRKKEDAIFQAYKKTALEMAQDETIPTPEIDENEKKNLFAVTINLMGIVKQQYINELSAALKQSPGGKPNLSEDADFLWSMVLTTLLFDPPADVISILAEKLGTDAETLIKVSKEAQEIEKGEFLPGLEPTKAEQIAKTADLCRQNRIAYELINKRGTSKIDRKAGYILNTLDNETTFALDIRESDPIEKTKDVIRVKWNAPYNEKGEQLRVTPFDQDIETIVSNFFDEGHPAVTTEQIYYAMTGQTASTGKPNKQILQAIEQSIKKLNTIPVSIRRVENGVTREEYDGNITVEGGTETIIAEYGTILDTAKTGYIEIQGKRRLAWISTRRGYLYSTEKMLGRLISTKRETLNLSASGISFTELTITLRRFCLMEIARFATTADYSIKDNKFLLDSMYLYEADPELVEITPDMKRKLKTGKTTSEQSVIRTMKKRRRDLLQKLLQHFKGTGEIIEWDFCQGDKKLPYTLDKDDANKRIYKGTADSVYIQVKKTGRTISHISTVERRIETAEKNRRRANKKDSQE